MISSRFSDENCKLHISSFGHHAYEACKFKRHYINPFFEGLDWGQKQYHFILHASCAKGRINKLYGKFHKNTSGTRYIQYSKNALAFERLAVDYGLLLLDVLNEYIYIYYILYQTSTCAKSCGCNTNAARTPYRYIICVLYRTSMTCTWQRTANYKNICKYFTVLHSPLARLCVFYSRSNINSSPSKVALKPGSTT